MPVSKFTTAVQRSKNMYHGYLHLYASAPSLTEALENSTPRPVQGPLTSTLTMPPPQHTHTHTSPVLQSSSLSWVLIDSTNTAPPPSGSDQLHRAKKSARLTQSLLCHAASYATFFHTVIIHMGGGTTGQRSRRLWKQSCPWSVRESIVNWSQQFRCCCC